VKIQLPGFGDRVVLAAGEDIARGNTARMDELLRIFTAEERASLAAYHRGRLFRRKPGEHKSTYRRQQGAAGTPAQAVAARPQARDEARPEGAGVQARLARRQLLRHQRPRRRVGA